MPQAGASFHCNLWGVQGAKPLGEVSGRSPGVFDIVKVFLTCIFVGNMMKFPKQLFVLCFKLHVLVKADICTLAFVSVFIYIYNSL